MPSREAFLDNGSDCLYPFTMADDPSEHPLLRPTAIAIHDNGQMPWELLGLQHVHECLGNKKSPVQGCREFKHNSVRPWQVKKWGKKLLPACLTARKG